MKIFNYLLMSFIILEGCVNTANQEKVDVRKPVVNTPFRQKNKQKIVGKWIGKKFMNDYTDTSPNDTLLIILNFKANGKVLYTERFSKQKSNDTKVEDSYNFENDSIFVMKNDGGWILRSRIKTLTDDKLVVAPTDYKSDLSIIYVVEFSKIH